MTDHIMSTIPIKSQTEKERRERQRGSRLSQKQQQRLITFLFLFLPLTLLIVFTYVPVLNMFWYSTLKWNGFSKDKTFIGMENYVEVFTRPELFGVFKVSLYYFAGAIVQLAFALYFATILSFNVRFKNLFKGMLFFPYLINGVAIGFVFLYFFRPDGTLDSLLALIGFNMDELNILWLGDRAINNYALSFVSIWRYHGLNFVLFLGAIQSISGDVYEAADIDGANRWQQFQHIIWPSILPILSLSFLLAARGSLSVFEIPYIMTKGSNGTMTFVIQTVDMAFKTGKVGLASAMAVVLLLIILLVAFIQRLLIKDEGVF